MLLVLQTFFPHSLPLSCFSFFFFHKYVLYLGDVSKLLKKTCAAFNDSLQMNVEQEGIRLRARPCGSRVVSREEAIKITVSNRSPGPVGGDSSAYTPLNLPFTHARSVRVASPDPVPLLHCLLEMEAAKVNKKPVRVIAAVCNNRGIGKDNQMPWSIP